MKTLLRFIPFPLLSILCAYSISQMLFILYVPLWDANQYFHCVVSAVQKPFSLFNFDCFGHPSVAITLLYGLLQYLKPGNILLYHISLLCITCVTIVIFYCLITQIFDKKRYKNELFLLTAIFAFYSPFYTNSLQLSLDQGVLLYFIIFLYVLFKKNFLLAGLCASALCFTKETGILLYLITTLLYSIVVYEHALYTQKPLKIKKYIPLLIPIFCITTYFFVKGFIFKQGIFWVGIQDNTISFQPFSAVFIAYCVELFILNFSWLLFLPIIFAIGKMSLLVVKKEYASFTKNSKLLFLSFLSFILFLALTFPKTYTNTRYFLPLYGLVPIFTFAAFLVLHIPRTFRMIFLGALLCIFFFSNFLLFDPLSKAIYGTFQFGNHKMLTITSLTHECCGYGRDQLVYNTEFVNLDTLQNIFFYDIKPKAQTFIVFADLANLSDPINPYTYKREMISNGIQPQYIPISALLKESILPRTIYYILYPNLDNTKNLQRLQMFYRVDQKKTYWQNGYALTVIKMGN